jgi:hypothetical protein
MPALLAMQNNVFDDIFQNSDNRYCGYHAQYTGQGAADGYADDNQKRAK